MNQELRIKKNNSTLKTIIHDSCFMIRKSKGFTLIELLVVIVILGILGSFTFANVFNGLPKARDAQRKNDLKQLQTALQLYYQDNNQYPTLTNCQSTTTCWTTLLGTNQSRYIKIIPKDPTNNNDHHYYYCSPATDNSKYTLVAQLENSNDQIGIPPNCDTPGQNLYWVTNP